VAAIAGLINVLARNQRLGTDDVVLPIAPLSTSYALTLTLAALYSHATVALNSVAGDNVDFALAASGVSPTIIIASSQSTLKYHNRLMQTQQGLIPKLSRYFQNKTLLKGNMPKTPSFALSGQQNFLSKLRLLFIYHRAGDKASPRLPTSVLQDLRILLGARTCYALTVPGIAGAISQTNLFDYRQAPAGDSHFGPPLSSVEVMLTGDDEKLGGTEPQGKVRSDSTSIRYGFGFELTNNDGRLWFADRRCVGNRRSWISWARWERIRRYHWLDGMACLRYEI
jgi:hypothetical protein